jgi:hypothetical protein
MVFKHERKYYSVHYDVGATELQDVDPFEREPNMIEVAEVRPITVTARKWVEVDPEAFEPPPPPPPPSKSRS